MIKRILLAATLAFAPVSAHAITLSIGQLMYTDLFLWNGQYGTPTWQQILSLYDCTVQLNFYLWNTPQPPYHVIVYPPPVPDPPPVNPPPCVDCDPPPCMDCNPPPCLSCDPDPPPTTNVPEPSTWVMLIAGFASLVFVKRWRRA